MNASLREIGDHASMLEGAGGSAFIVFIVHPVDRVQVASVLEVQGKDVVPFQFESHGA